MKQEKQNKTGEREESDYKLHFGDYFGSAGSRILSVVAGLLVGIVLSMFFGWQIGTLAGACTVLLMSVLLPILVFRADIPYVKIKKTIPAPFLFDERVRFTVRNGRTVGGFFVLTEKTMVFLSIEQGNHRLELSREDVKSIVLEEEQYSIRIFLNDKQFIQVVSGVCTEMFEILREQNWSTN